MTFEFGDRWIGFGEYKIAFRVWTLENVYGVEAPLSAGNDANLVIDATGFFAAGGQLHADGNFHAEIVRAGDQVRVTAHAAHSEKIKAIGVLVQGLPELAAAYEYPWTATQPDEITREIPIVFPEVLTLQYPMAHRAPFPIFLTRDAAGSQYYAENMDEQVRPKRFRVSWDKRHTQIVELIFVEAATKFRNEIEMPEWRFGRAHTPAEVYAPRLELMREKWNLKPWQERADVPAWMREVSLVAMIHGEHWTGYAFNTFAQMRAHLEFIARHIEGRRVLVFLPAWDGRYYFNYPRYRVSEHLGGAVEFQRLMDTAHGLGMHVVPMLGLNGMNLKWADELGLEDAIAHTAHGWEDIVNFVDWDGDGSGEEQVHWANPGNPNYQNHIVTRVSELVERFGIDGTFLDISNWYANDPRWDYFEGTRALLTRIKEKFPQLLLFGEGWYDALLPLIPLYHTQIFPAHLNAFGDYARSAYHLSMPAPGAGSSGVHEGGFRDYVPQKFSPILIPTLPIVDDTLPEHTAEVLRIIEIAHVYANYITR